MEKKVDLNLLQTDYEKYRIEISESITESYDEYKFTHCILFLDFYSGINRTQINIIKNNIYIGHWMIVFVGERSDLVDINPYIRRLRSELANADVNIEIFQYFNDNNFEIIDKWLETCYNSEIAIPKDFDKSKKICVIIFLSSFLKTNKLKNILEKELSKYNLLFINLIEAEDKKSLQNMAHKIVFVGNEVTDFFIKPEVLKINNIIFLLDEAENNPLFYNDIKLAKNIILNNLNSQGWGLSSQGLNSIFIGSSLYYHCLKENHADPHDLTLFDDYGLPLPHYVYSIELLEETNNKNGLCNLLTTL